MQNFHIVFSIVQQVLMQGSQAGRVQVERLHQALVNAGDTEESELIQNLLVKASAPKGSTSRFLPSSLSASLPGEQLNKKSTRLPVDRETSAPLAEVISANELAPKNLVLPDSLRKAVESLIDEWIHLAELEKIGVSPSRSVLLFGVPGTGKTQLAMSIAKQLGLPIILARLDGLISSFLGTTSRNIGNLFEFANRHKALLLLDEFDALAKLRDDSNEIGEIKRVVNTLLQHLDQRRQFGITIGITNHPQLLDPAIWRRFEAQIELPKPPIDVREEIIRNYMAPMTLSSSICRLIAWCLNDCSGAEIEDFVQSIKKNYVLKGDGMPIIDRLIAIAHTHVARIPADRRNWLMRESRLLAKHLHENEKFSQIHLAEIFEVNRATISRWLTSP